MEVTDGLEGFVEVVGHGSLTAAAHALGVPRSTLSRQLARLEDRVGVRLVHRTTRRLVLTRAGEELFSRARRIVDDAKAAVDAVQRHDDVPRGRLRVAAPPIHDAYVSAPLLSFVRRYPEVELELEASSRIVDLVAEGFDVAIRGGVQAPTDHVRRGLFRSDRVAVAAPAYLAARGRPEVPADLERHDLILGFDGGAPERAWPLVGGGAVKVSGAMVTNDVALRRSAALDGVGVALVPIPSVRPEIHAGSLEVVLPEVVGSEAWLSVVYPERAFLHPKVRAFVDHLLEWAASLPPDPCANRAGQRARAS